MAEWMATAACIVFWMLCGAAATLAVAMLALRRGGDDETINEITGKPFDYAKLAERLDEEEDGR